MMDMTTIDWANIRSCAFGVGYGLAKNPWEADDVAQDTCLRLIERGVRSDSSPIENVEGYAAVVSMNAFRMHIRSASRRREREARLARMTRQTRSLRYRPGVRRPDPRIVVSLADKIVNDESMEALLTQLSERQRQCVDLLYRLDMKPREIALELDISRQAVESNISRARSALVRHFIESMADQTALAGLDLSGISLSGAQLARADLKHVDLRAAVLKGSVLDGAHLQGADLSHCILDDSSLREANLNGADLTGTSLRRVDLRGADLRNAVIQDTDCEGALFRDCDLRGVTLIPSAGAVDGIEMATLSLDAADPDLRLAELRDALFNPGDLAGVRISIEVIRMIEGPDPYYDNHEDERDFFSDNLGEQITLCLDTR